MPMFIPRINAPAACLWLTAMYAASAASQTTALPAGNTSAHHHKLPRHPHRPRDTLPQPATRKDINATPSLPGSPAPVPDEATLPPERPSTPVTDVSPAIMGLHYPEIGNGYVRGSSPQAMDDKSAASAGGVQVTVPLSSAAPAPLPPPTGLAPPP